MIAVQGILQCRVYCKRILDTSYLCNLWKNTPGSRNQTYSVYSLHYEDLSVSKSFLDSSDLTVNAKVYGVIPNSAGKERNTSACDNTLQYPAYMDLMTVLSGWEMHSWHQQSCNRATAPLHFKEPQNQFLYTVYLIIYSI